MLPRMPVRTTWLRGIDADAQLVNIGIHSVWRKADDRVLWRRIVDTATLHYRDTPLKKKIRMRRRKLTGG